MSISPALGATVDFTNPVVYTVTANDGRTRDYTVTLTTKETQAAQVAYSLSKAKYYTSLQDAIDDSAGTDKDHPDTIVLCADIPVTGTISIPNGKHVKLIAERKLRAINRSGTHTGNLIDVSSGASL